MPPEDFDRIPSWSDVADWPGRIVGACDYAADGNGDDKWNEGYSCWWHLSNVVCFDASIPCRGNVGMWQMPSALAAQVTAADALARSVGEKVASADDARRLFSLAAHVAGRSEGLFVLPLDAERRALAAPVLVSLGTETTTAIQPSAVFAEAIKVGANSIIIAHNHPSGDPTPSKADYDTTAKLNAGAKLVGLELIDHIIIGSPESANRLGFVSMAELIA